MPRDRRKSSTSAILQMARPTQKTMSEYVYRITPTRAAMLTAGPTPEEREIISKHFRYLEGLLHAGPLTLAGRTTNDDASTFGLVLLETDEATARSIMENDPAVREGVMRAELFPFHTALRRT